MRTPSHLLPAAMLLACGACGTAPETPAAAVERPAIGVRHSLPAGATVRLLSAERTTSAEAPFEAIDGWFREAMRQTAAFDLAAGSDDVERLPDRPVWQVALQCDPTARVLTTTLRIPDQAPVPLHSARYDTAPLAIAIDELALGTRIALGDPADQETLPCALCYSHDPRAGQEVERARRAVDEGRLREAARSLTAARRLDGGSPVVLDALAAVQSLIGQSAEARALAEEALSYRARVSAPVLHRLARTLLLARASLQPASAPDRDQELLALAEASLRERPHDMQGLLSQALALSFLGRFAESAPLWRRLHTRLPQSATAVYHLGWAELAEGRPAAAAEAFARSAPRLPLGATVTPRAISLYEQGDHETLRGYFDGLLADPDLGEGAPGCAVRRMQAAHAILTDRIDEAARLLLSYLEWLRQRPSLLLQRAGELAETGEVLMRLGRAEDLQIRLQALEQLALADAPLQDALSYLQGLVQVARSGDRARAAESALLRQGRLDPWGYALQAIGHRARGELLEEHTALSQAARLSDSALVKASLVRNLRAMGRPADADRLRQAIRREMHEVHLRRRLSHPLLAPELALAFRVD